MESFRFLVTADNGPVKLTDNDITVYPGTVFELSEEQARTNSIRIALRSNWIQFYKGEMEAARPDSFDEMLKQWKNAPVNVAVDSDVSSLPKDFNNWEMGTKVQWIKTELKDENLLGILTSVGVAEIQNAAKEKLDKLHGKKTNKVIMGTGEKK